MAETPDKITVRQLLYSNVEVDQSPAGRRGFQIWLYTEGFTEPQRREISKRLEDFQVPDTKAGSEAGEFHRHAFFSTSDGSFVVARTVPTARKDKFGRGGLFHAHALILGREDFERCGNNPFALFDSGFPFQDGPEAALEAGADLRRGFIPPVSLIVRPPSPAACSPALGSLLPELVCWLRVDDYQTVVLAEPSLTVRDRLRQLFAVLPAGLRARASFDTMSTGESLGTIRYRLVGAHSPEVLRRWHFRKFSRIDLAGALPTCHPPVAAESDPLLENLASQWVSEPVPDASRQAAYELLYALKNDDVTEDLFQRVDDQAIASVGRIPDIDAVWRRAIGKRVEKDIADRQIRKLIGAELETYFGDFGRDFLTKLAIPLPDDKIAGWLLQVFEQPGRPGTDQIHALLGWANKRSIASDLKLKAYRWLPEHLSKLEKNLHHPDRGQELIQFRNWYKRTLSGPLPLSAATTKDLALRLSKKASLLKNDLHEVQLFLAVCGAEMEPDKNRTRIRFLTAYHAGQKDRMIEALKGEAGNDLRTWLFNEWLVNPSFQIGIDYGWLEDETGCFQVGLLLSTRGSMGGKRWSALLGALADANNECRKQFRDFWLATGGFLSPYKASNVPLIDTLSPITSSECSEKVRQIGADYRKEKWDALKEAWGLISPAGFEEAVNFFLLKKLRGGKLICRPVPPRHWVGLQIEVVDHDRRTQTLRLLRTVLESLPAGRLIDGSVEPCPPQGHTLDKLSRFRWLLFRLNDPNGTEKLPIYQPLI